MLTKYNGREGRCQVAARGARPRGGHSHGRPRSQPGFGKAQVTQQRREGCTWRKPAPAWCRGLFLTCPPVLEHSSGQLVKCPTAAFH